MALPWENLQKVFVMLVVVLHSLLFDVFVMLLFIHCFSTSSLALPWAIARFLHPFYSFSPAHRRVIRDTFILTFLDLSVTVLLWVLRIWESFFTLRYFLPYTPSRHSAVLPWWLQGSNDRPSPSVCLNHSVQQKVLVIRFYLRVTAGI